MIGRALACALLAWLVFAGASQALREMERLERQTELLRVRLPLPVQIAYSGGDAFLAANINVFRGLMVDAKVSEPETYRIQAQLQADAAWLNPWHEDNYYVGAAILPWNGQVDAAQYVLKQASLARVWDMWPPFFYAFNAMYFEHDMNQAGEWAEVAAQRHPTNAAALRDMAAKWYERGDDPVFALGILRAMHEQSRDDNFRLLLEARMQRLEGLRALRRAQQAYQAEQGKPPASLGDMVGYAGLAQLPQDPLMLGYMLDAAGVPQLVDHVASRKSQ